MKLLFYASIFIFLLACKGSATDSPITPDDNSTKVRIINGVSFAEDNVSIKNKNTLELNKYYTLLDTLDLNDPVLTSSNVCALFDEGDSLSVSWRLAGKTVFNYQHDKIWHQEVKKWLACNEGSFPLNREPASLTLEATVLFLKSNKSVIREYPIQVISKDYYYDLYEVNFGMSRTQVKTNEVARIPNFPTAWLEPTPSTAVSGFNTNLSVNETITYYEFENDKLKKVSDVILDLDYFVNLQSLAKRYNVPIKPTLKSSLIGGERVYELTNEQVWNNGKIKFTLSKKEVQVNSSEKKKLFAITYEKL